MIFSLFRNVLQIVEIAELAIKQYTSANSNFFFFFGLLLYVFELRTVCNV